MKVFIRILKASALILGVFLLFAVLAFTKIWLNDKNAAGAAETGDITEATTELSVKSVNSSPSPEGGYAADPGSTTVPTETPLPEEVGPDPDATTPEPVVSPAIEPKTKPELETYIAPTVQPEVTPGAGRELYHNVLAEFCRNVMEPIGYTLHSEEFIQTGGDSGSDTILLYFTSTEKMSFEAKKFVATRLGSFIYLGFEEQTGFKTDYLKVHLQLPEGESFALPRENYRKWVLSGSGYDSLFEDYMINMITRQENSREEKPVPFKAADLEQYLSDAGFDGFASKVEGQEAIDSRIYIYMDKEKNKLDPGVYEDNVTKLCQEVFRNFYTKTNQRIDAFKLIDPEADTVFVIYRDVMEILWPKGSSDKRLREFIKSGKPGILN